ncbi:hypothetical protein ACFFX1_53280 [Dactylosporangium sucinum]|uniref:Uncharacterized protein n=1 Tax=Dactylosporangium sucinum TaxID=1424081 RepID=A0A917X4J2_9ACTN|nr:hypothetical protein [Dactylosporangium sucinum]GGM72151.1 hypothetical protein GCM10007977_087360 [Dactylosporangium sucinum]
MAEHAGTPESYERFVVLFRASTIGIAGTGTPAQDAQGRIFAAGDFGAGRTTHGGGRPRILAFADPEAAIRNFGPRCNAGVPGEALLQPAATDPDCATREISLVISRSTAESLLAAPTEPPGGRR